MAKSKRKSKKIFKSKKSEGSSVISKNNNKEMDANSKHEINNVNLVLNTENTNIGEKIQDSTAEKGNNFILKEEIEKIHEKMSDDRTFILKNEIIKAEKELEEESKYDKNDNSLLEIKEVKNNLKNQKILKNEENEIKKDSLKTIDYNIKNEKNDISFSYSEKIDKIQAEALKRKLHEINEEIQKELGDDFIIEKNVFKNTIPKIENEIEIKTENDKISFMSSEETIEEKDPIKKQKPFDTKKAALDRLKEVLLEESRKLEQGATEVKEEHTLKIYQPYQPKKEQSYLVNIKNFTENGEVQNLSVLKEEINKEIEKTGIEERFKKAKEEKVENNRKLYNHTFKSDINVVYTNEIGNVEDKKKNGIFYKIIRVFTCGCVKL